MKFHDAPCHIPPRSIVFIILRFVVVLWLPLLNLMLIHTARAISPIAIPTYILPESSTATSPIAIMMMYEVAVILRLPPRGI